MTIVVAYADTEPGHAALRAAVQEAVLRRQDIVVTPPVSDFHPTEQDITAFLAGSEEDLGTTGVQLSVKTSQLHDPADAVIQVAQEVGASAICLGLRHRTAIGKLLLGSTAQRILLDAPCTIIAVKPS